MCASSRAQPIYLAVPFIRPAQCGTRQGPTAHARQSNDPAAARPNRQAGFPSTASYGSSIGGRHSLCAAVSQNHGGFDSRTARRMYWNGQSTPEGRWRRSGAAR